MTNHHPLDFDKNVSGALKDAQLIKNIKSAMATLVSKRKTIFSDAAETEQLRTLGNALKTDITDIVFVKPDVINSFFSGPAGALGYAIEYAGVICLKTVWHIQIS